MRHYSKSNMSAAIILKHKTKSDIGIRMQDKDKDTIATTRAVVHIMIE